MRRWQSAEAGPGESSSFELVSCRVRGVLPSPPHSREFGSSQTACPRLAPHGLLFATIQPAVAQHRLRLSLNLASLVLPAQQQSRPFALPSLAEIFQSFDFARRHRPMPSLAWLSQTATADPAEAASRPTIGSSPFLRDRLLSPFNRSDLATYQRMWDDVLANAEGASPSVSCAVFLPKRAASCGVGSLANASQRTTLSPSNTAHTPQHVLDDLLTLVPRIASCWAKTVTLPLEGERENDEARQRRLRLTYARLKRDETVAEADSEEVRQRRERESSFPAALGSF